MQSSSPEMTLFEACQVVHNHFSILESDFAKAYLLSYLAQYSKLQGFIQLSLDEPTTFYSIALSIAKNGGRSYGVDPCSPQDFTIHFKNHCDYGETIEFLHTSFEQAVCHFSENIKSFDLISFDETCTANQLQQILEQLPAKSSNPVFLVLSRMDKNDLRHLDESMKSSYVEVFCCPTFSILTQANSQKSFRIQRTLLTQKLTELYYKIPAVIARSHRIPTITVGVLTYNHELFIEECLRSVTKQTGPFSLHVVICDDCSTDTTEKKVLEFIHSLEPTQQSRITYVRNKSNLGVVQNLKQLISYFKESDFFAFCEGDDYYLSSDKLATHLALHKKNPQVVLSFDQMLLYQQTDDSFFMHTTHSPCQPPPFDTSHLIFENFIGSFSSCFYDTRILQYIPDHLFDVFCVDWLFNIFCSQYGELKKISTPMTIYRIHPKSVWQSLSPSLKNKKLIHHINQYNKKLNHLFDTPFTKKKKTLKKTNIVKRCCFKAIRIWKKLRAI